MTFVDARGHAIARTTPEEATGSPSGRDVELPRGTLARLLYERTRNDVEYVFEDSITGLDERDDGVHVTFRRGAPRTVPRSPTAAGRCHGLVARCGRPTTSSSTR